MKLIKSAIVAIAAMAMAASMISCGSTSNAAAGAADAPKAEKKKETVAVIPEGKEGYEWNFQNVPFVEKSTIKDFILVPSEPAGMALTLAAGGYFNRIDSAKGSNLFAKKAGATNGCIQPAGPNTKDANGHPATVSTVAKGPFTAKMFVTSTGEGDKTGRHAFIKIGDTENINPKFADYVPGTGSNPAGFWLEASYTGTDEVPVQFGGTDLIVIWHAAIIKD